MKFGSFVILLAPLKIFQNLFVQMSDIIFTINQNFHHTFYREAINVQYQLQPFPRLVMKPNRMCLLLTPLLLPLIIWLAEMLSLLRKIHF